MIAVIKTGGKQYIVKEGDILKIEKLNAEPGAKVSFEVLLTAEPEGLSVAVGTPLLDKKVEAEVLEQGRGDKISVVKYKAKSRYRRRVGHRQHAVLGLGRQRFGRRQRGDVPIGDDVGMRRLAGQRYRAGEEGQSSFE